MLEWRQAGDGGAVDRQLGLHRRAPIQCFCWIGRSSGSPANPRTGGWARPTRWNRSARRRDRRARAPSARSLGRAWPRPCRRGRRGRGRSRRCCRASPRPCPRARRCRGPRASRRRRRRGCGDVAQVADREVVERVAEAIVARPAPHQRHRARELHRLVGVAGIGGGAEPHRAVGHDLVRDLAAAGVERVGDVAQPEQVLLDRLELADRDRGERRVLAVGGEHPRIVRVARADERGLPQGRDRRRVLLALVDEADPQVGRGLREVGDVLLAPVHGLLQLAVAGQVEGSSARTARRATRPSRRAGGWGRAVRRRARGVPPAGPGRSRRARSTRSRANAA